MSVLGTIAALFYIGGNLIKDSYNQKQLENAVNKPEDRIQYRGGKYWDTITRRQVYRTFVNDPDAGPNTLVWRDVHTQTEVYCPAIEEWHKNNIIWEAKIAEAQAAEDPGFLREAEEAGLRYAKCVLPYFPGLHKIEYGYYDRMQKVKDGEERRYYKENYAFPGFLVRVKKQGRKGWYKSHESNELMREKYREEEE